MTKPTIVAVHLLNDYSGSPRIFSHSINVLHKDGYAVHLYTSRSVRGGFLSSVRVNKRYSFFYRWSPNKYLTLIAFLYCQTLLFFRMLKYINRPVIFYVNTVLPFGVALAGKLMNKKVVYHVHETYIRPAMLKKFLFGIAERCATRVIYVSEFLKTQDPFIRPPGVVIHNSVDRSFLEKAGRVTKRIGEDPTVILMICSLKRYKGVDEFLLLAQRNPTLRFELVMNAGASEIQEYFMHQYLPANLSVFTVQEDVHEFYSRATLLVNLSRPDLFLETFGMTILEAQCYGIPCIVPPVGGVTELVTDNVNGYYADSRYIANVEKCVQQLLSDEGLYQRMSGRARENVLNFSCDVFSMKIKEVFSQVSASKSLSPSSVSPDTPGSLKNHVAVIGSAGVPARYGGFETLAHQLVTHLSQDFRLTVYCSSTLYPKKERQKIFSKARLFYVPLKPNGWQSIPYDLLSMVHALFYADVLLVLGVSCAWLFPVIKFFTGKKIIVCMDGIEWKRAKWFPLIQRYLKWCEKIAVRYAHKVITDNKAIYDYVAAIHGKKSALIEYGGDQAYAKRKNAASQERYSFLSSPYAFSVCRIEPENNLHMLLEAFSLQPKKTLVIVGNWNQSEYGKQLFEQYSKYQNLFLLHPIYQPEELEILRSNCFVYLHGHSTGGTNPSLVEAMTLGVPVVTYDVSYNRATTENKAFYFKNTEALIRICNDKQPDEYAQNALQMKAIAKKRYQWARIAGRYRSLFTQIVTTTGPSLFPLIRPYKHSDTAAT